MYRLGLVDTLVKGFGLAFLSGVRRCFMPPELKTNKTLLLRFMMVCDYEFWHVKLYNRIHLQSLTLRHSLVIENRLKNARHVWIEI